LKYSNLPRELRVGMSEFSRQLAIKKFDEAQVFKEYELIIQKLQGLSVVLPKEPSPIRCRNQ
jgi:hypothetical protein